jgi:uncharacterized delta-60 repeat protein
VADFLPGADNGHDAAQAVLVQADGRILAAGSGVAGGTSVDFAVARYLADGSLDPRFNNDGLVTTDFVGYLDEIRDLAVDASGRVVAGGRVASSRAMPMRSATSAWRAMAPMACWTGGSAARAGSVPTWVAMSAKGSATSAPDPTSMEVSRSPMSARMTNRPNTQAGGHS